jgi:hypothetical protein
MVGASSSMSLQACNLCTTMVWFMVIFMLFVNDFYACCVVHLSYSSLYCRKTSYETKDVAILSISASPNFLINRPHSPLRLRSPQISASRNYLMARRRGTRVPISFHLDLPCIRYFDFLDLTSIIDGSSFYSLGPDHRDSKHCEGTPCVCGKWSWSGVEGYMGSDSTLHIRGTC